MTWKKISLRKNDENVVYVRTFLRVNLKNFQELFDHSDMEIKTSFWEPVIIKNELRLKHFALKLSKKGATNTIKKKKSNKKCRKGNGNRPTLFGGALIYVPIWKGEFWSDSSFKHLIRNQKLARNLTSQSLSLLRF